MRKGIIAPEKNITFEKWVEKEGWWGYERCTYVRSKHARGRVLSRRYVDIMESITRIYLLPAFGPHKLQKINPRLIDRWLLDLREQDGPSGKPLNTTTINGCLTCLKIMLGQAVKDEYLVKNPAAHISNFKEDPKRRGILSVEEVRELFAEKNFNLVWEGNRLHFCANLLAATTGMRQGELLALQVQHVHNDHVEVVHSWHPNYGLKEPKCRSFRTIPLPHKTSIELRKLIEGSFFQEPGHFLSSLDGVNPVRFDAILRHFYRALGRIGITKELRIQRNICFHSWRHWFNSVMRGKIHDSKLRQLTGHRTPEMIEAYTHFKLDDFRDVIEVQDQLWSG